MCTDVTDTKKTGPRRFVCPSRRVIFLCGIAVLFVLLALLAWRFDQTVSSLLHLSEDDQGSLLLWHAAHPVKLFGKGDVLFLLGLLLAIHHRKQVAVAAWLAGRSEVIAGFGSLIALLGLFSLLLPAGGTALPPDHQLVLFYSSDCRHCAEVRTELEDRKIATAHLPVREYAAFLKILGIEHVPTLMVNGTYEKIFLTGSEAIRNYLSCQPTPSAPSRAAKRSTPSPAGNGSGIGHQAGQIDLFAPMIGPGQILSPRPDDGLCKEDVKCD